jgi:hypothetical protein
MHKKRTTKQGTTKMKTISQKQRSWFERFQIAKAVNAKKKGK